MTTELEIPLEVEPVLRKFGSDPVGGVAGPVGSAWIDECVCGKHWVIEPCSKCGQRFKRGYYWYDSAVKAVNAHSRKHPFPW